MATLPSRNCDRLKSHRNDRYGGRPERASCTDENAVAVTSSQHRPPRQDRRARPSPKPIYIPRVTSPASNSASRSVITLYNTLTARKSPAPPITGAHVLTRPVRHDTSTLPKSEPVRVGQQTARVMLKCRLTHAAHRSLLHPHHQPFDPLLGDILGALQVLVHAAWCLAPSHAVRRVPHRARKIRPPNLRSRVVAALDKPPQAQQAP